MERNDKKQSAQQVLANFRRQEIIVAAFELIQQVGFTRMTMEKLAEEAGVAKGTIYTYFKDKADLMSVLMTAVSDDLLHTIEESSIAEGSIEKRLNVLIEGLYSFYRKHYQIFSLIHDSDEHKKVNKKDGVSRVIFNKLINSVAEIFASAQENGEMRQDIEPRLVAMMLMTTLHQLFHYGHSEKEMDLRAAALTTIDIYLNGIRNRGDNE